MRTTYLLYILSILCVWVCPISYGQDLFIQKLEYNTNNQITQQHYQHLQQQHIQTYQYDGIDRLVRSAYNQPQVGGGVLLDNAFNTKYVYDLNGNLLQLERNTFINNSVQKMDSLIYSYSAGSNQLDDIVDYGSLQGYRDGGIIKKYEYNKNGQLAVDNNLDFLTRHNILNRVDTVVATNGSQTILVYNATGKKIAVKHLNSLGQIQSELLYIDQLVYAKTSNGTGYLTHKIDGIIQYIPHNSQLTTILHLRDHLTNLHLTVSDLNTDYLIDSVEVLQEQHYYPYGLAMEVPTTIGAQSFLESMHQYNGGEPQGVIKQRTEKLWLELGTEDIAVNQSFYRTYDPTIGRWWQLDPKPREWEASYVGYGANPIRYNDLLGDTIYPDKKREPDAVKAGEDKKIEPYDQNEKYASFSKVNNLLVRSNLYYAEASHFFVHGGFVLRNRSQSDGTFIPMNSIDANLYVYTNSSVGDKFSAEVTKKNGQYNAAFIVDQESYRLPNNPNKLLLTRWFINKRHNAYIKALVETSYTIRLDAYFTNSLKSNTQKIRACKSDECKKELKDKGSELIILKNNSKKIAQIMGLIAINGTTRKAPQWRRNPITDFNKKIERINKEELAEYIIDPTTVPKELSVLFEDAFNSVIQKLNESCEECYTDLQENHKVGIQSTLLAHIISDQFNAKLKNK